MYESVHWLTFLWCYRRHACVKVRSWSIRLLIIVAKAFIVQLAEQETMHFCILSAQIFWFFIFFLYFIVYIHVSDRHHRSLCFIWLFFLSCIISVIFMTLYWRLIYATCIFASLCSIMLPKNGPRSNCFFNVFFCVHHLLS